MGPPTAAPEKAKPLTSTSLAATDAGVSEPPEGISEKLRRYGTAKARNRQMAGHLVLERNQKLADRLYDCGSLLHFRHYLAHQQTRLIRTNSCDVSLLCPLCAIRRGAKQLRRYLERCEILAPAHDFELVTLTVKNGPDLAERFQHLLSAWKRLNERAKKGYGAFADASGAFMSIEFTKTAAGWHPHVHMIWAMPKGTPPLRWGENSPLGIDWKAATGDSYIVHAERIGEHGPDGKRSAGGTGSPNPLTSALCEVLKYAVKFGDLELTDNLHAYRVLKGKRLTRAYGCFFGLEVPEQLDDDELDGPYIDLFYRYTSEGYLAVPVHGHTLGP